MTTPSPIDLWLQAPCVVVLIGASGSGKSHWSSQLGLEVLASDGFRALLTDDEDHQGCSAMAFDLIEQLAGARLGFARPVVIDATNTRAQTRQRWLDLARSAQVPAFALHFDVSMQTCLERQSLRARQVQPHVIERQHRQMQGLHEQLAKEPWDGACALDEQGAVRVLKPWSPGPWRRLDAHGRLYTAQAVDIVGDVHGCLPELLSLMEKLGWQRSPEGQWSHPQQRLLVFVGDLTDRGPDSVGVVELVAQMVASGHAALVMGNHDDKLRRYLLGNKIKAQGGLATTVAEIEALTEPQRQAFVTQALALFDDSCFWAGFAPDAQGARVVVSHAAWKPDLVGQKKNKVRYYCIYGPNTGEVDEDGFPERLDWRQRYPKQAPLCVTGHTPYKGHPRLEHNTLCVDTGCVFGHRLSALRYPSMQIVQTPALETYADKTLRERPLMVSYEAWNQRKREQSPPEPG